MPAVELSRLNKQAEELAGLFHQPDEFRRLLLDRMEFYADRVTRSGNLAKPAPLIPRFNLPDLFLQVIEQVLQKPASSNPEAAINLARNLWQDTRLEPRLLATSLIGMAASQMPEMASELLVEYCTPQESPLVQQALLQRSGTQLRAANVRVWFDLVERWINASGVAQQLIGFKAILGVINDREFENLPLIYRILTFSVENINRITSFEIENLIRALAKRSPVETAFFLRQCYTRSSNPILGRLVRRSLPAFEVEGQESLRKTLQDQNPSQSGS
jgi:hypothetical protein